MFSFTISAARRQQDGDYIPAPEHLNPAAIERHERRIMNQREHAIKAYHQRHEILPLCVDDAALQRSRIRMKLPDVTSVPIGSAVADSLPPVTLYRKRRVLQESDAGHLAGCFVVGPPRRPPMELAPISARKSVAGEPVSSSSLPVANIVGGAMGPLRREKQPPLTSRV